MTEPKKRRLEEENVSLEEIYSETTGWFDIPYEMRKIVIDDMDVETRCRFTICSTKCENEAKMSKKLFTSMAIGRGIFPELYIGHDEYGYRYCLEFMEVSNLSNKTTFVVYKTTANRTNPEKETRVMKWMKIVENESAEQVRNRYLIEIMEKYQNNIVSLKFDDNKLVFNDEINFKILKNLKKIIDRTGIDLVKNGLLDASQIIGAETVVAEQTRLTLKKLMQLEASECKVRCNNLHGLNMAEFLKMFQTGKCLRNMKHLKIYTEGTILIDDFSDELGINFVEDEDDYDEIYSYFDFDVAYDDKHFKATFTSYFDHIKIDVRGK